MLTSRPDERSRQRRWSKLSGGVLFIITLSVPTIVGVFNPTISSADVEACPAPTINAAETVVTGTECSDKIVVTDPSVKKVVGGGGNDIIYVSPGVETVEGGPGDDIIYGDLPEGMSLESDPAIGDVASSSKADRPFLRAGSRATLSIPRADARQNRLLFKQLMSRPNGRRSGKHSRHRRHALTVHSRKRSVSATASWTWVECHAAEYCYGGTGNQTLSGDEGNDVIFGQRGDDTIYGNGGNDLLYGGIGDDEAIYGGPGNDLLSGGPGHDALLGEEGNDMLRGDGTNDYISGGSGSDTVSYATADTPGFTGKSPVVESRHITGFPESGVGTGVEVRLDGSSGHEPPTSCGARACNGGANSYIFGGGDDEVVYDIENVVGSPYDDVIVGNSSANKIYGGGGADVIIGDGGADELHGGPEDDYIEGGSEGHPEGSAFGEQGANNCIYVATSEPGCGTAHSVASVTPANQVTVGVMAPNSPATEFSELYLTGGNEGDNVTAKYFISGGKGYLRFSDSTTHFSLESGDKSSGCTYPVSEAAPQEVVCEWPGVIDSVNMAGLAGNDVLSTHEAELLPTVSTMIQGGADNDKLYGDGWTEDVITDGAGNGSDELTGYGYDDFLSHSGGKDTLLGGDGDDLLVSSTLCTETNFWGGEGTNDASWAPMFANGEDPSKEGIVADLETETAGNGWSENAPTCPGGVAHVDLFHKIQDLEGTQGPDTLIGNSEANFLKGWFGKDKLYGKAGDDLLNGAGDHESDELFGGTEEKEKWDECVVDGGSTDITSECDGHVRHVNEGPIAATSSASTPSGRAVTLSGSINPEGTATDYVFEVGTSPSEEELLVPLNGYVGGGAGLTNETGTVEKLRGGRTYYYRLNGSSDCDPESSDLCTSYGEQKAFNTPSWRPAVVLGETLFGHATATIRGIINPEGFDTHHHFEWGPTESYGHSVPVPNGDLGEGTSPVGVEQTIGGLGTEFGPLQSETKYYYRLVAESEEGTVEVKNSFITPHWAPTVNTKFATNGAETAATMNATVNPNEFEATYHFEYGHTASYGTSTSEVAIGEGTKALEEVKELTGLEPGTTYHYRVVATNPTGTSKGQDERFTAGWTLGSAEGETLNAVSCTSSSQCTGVGVSGTSTLGERWNGAKWETQSTLNPTEAKASVLTGVSCISATECMAAGYYETSSGRDKTLAERWTAGKWEILATPNQEGTTTTGNVLAGVSCQTASSCVAVGDYATKSGEVQGSKALALRWSGTTWTLEEPTNWSTATHSYLKSVTCYPSECTAVGYYQNEASEYVALEAGWFGSGWSVTAMPVVSGAKGEWLESLGCSAPGVCTAAGRYESKSGITEPLIDRINEPYENNWAVQTVPTPEGMTSSELFAVSCAVTNSCTAFGRYQDASGSRTLGESWNGSSWTLDFPFNAVGRKEAGYLRLNGASCEHLGICTAVGYYENSSSGHSAFADGFSMKVAPTVRTDKATGITATGATLHGAVNPNGLAASYHFEWGTSPSFGHNTSTVELGEGQTSVQQSAEIIGLEHSTNYYFRIVSTNAAGTSYGETLLFKAARIWGTQITPNPSGAKASKLLGVSCNPGSVFGCAAVGEYQKSSGVYQSLAERWNGSKWEIQSTPETTYNTALQGVSCITAAECIAVGYTLNSGGSNVTLAERWNGTKWETQSIPNPGLGGVLTGISCTSSSECTAVGYYKATTTETKTLAERWNGTKWETQTTPNKTAASLTELTGVSCTTFSVLGSQKKECIASGYSDLLGTYEAQSERWNGTEWTLKSVVFPEEHPKASYLLGVSCTSTTECMAVGTYENSSSLFVPLGDSWSGYSTTTWSLRTPAYPSGSKLAKLAGASCGGSKLECTAVGEYENSSSVYQALGEHWNGTGWELQTVPNPEGAKASYLKGISCLSEGECFTVGYDENSSGTLVTLAERYW